jgi:outer membrane biosynthesis protein TonB
MDGNIRVVSLALMIWSWTTAVQAQVQPNEAIVPTRQAPVGHRQPTPDSVGKAEVEHGTNPAPQPQPQPQPEGRDYGSELSICRGC